MISDLCGRECRWNWSTILGDGIIRGVYEDTHPDDRVARVLVEVTRHVGSAKNDPGIRLGSVLDLNVQQVWLVQTIRTTP